MEKAFLSAVALRDEHGHFVKKGVMELSEAERQELLDSLEGEHYENYNGFHISERKIEAVRAGLYREEVFACEILAKQGFDMYLLDEKYVAGKKADTFFRKDGIRDFLELKHTGDKKITKQYNSSIEQAPNCFIVIDGYMSKIQKTNLENAITENKNARNVYVYIKSSGLFLKIK